MAASDTGEKKRLIIERCTSSGGKVTESGETFELMLNPSQYNHQHSISYSTGNSSGLMSTEPKFKANESEMVTFNFTIDGTGVVVPETGPAPDDVKIQIKALKDIVYRYDGNEHEPPIARLIWGSLLFDGRLESMSVEYTLFKPSGEPLRARVSLSFISYMTKLEETKRAARSSPDLTHLVIVRQGDTLPLLCHRIYKDSSYYLEIARVNNLVDFRNIKAGTRLHFPPLR